MQHTTKHQPKLIHDWQTHIFVLFLLLASAILRLYHLAIPQTYVFDEVYHAVTAKLYARNDPAGYEWWHQSPEPNTAIEWLHPPVAKLLQAASIRIFGETSMGWRFASVVFGVGTIWMTYCVTKELTQKKLIIWLATLFVSLDGLLLAQSRIAMNDIFVVFFLLCTIWTYLRWKKTQHISMLILTGISAGLSLSTKWSGVFIIPCLLVDQCIEWISNSSSVRVKNVINALAAFILLPPLIYILSFTQFWIQRHSWKQFVELHRQIWHYQTHLKATHSYQSTPIQWFLDLRPVWMYVDYSVPGKVGNIYNLGNPIIFWVGIPAILWMLVSQFRKPRATYQLLLLTYIMVWVPWMLSPRIMFFYHYAPAVPLLCIIVAFFLDTIAKTWKWGIIIALSVAFLAIAWFVVFYPYLTGIPMPISFVKQVYQILPMWK